MNNRLLSNLIHISNDFVTQRNWWPHHNPKNDAMNIFVEAGELAEYVFYLKELDYSCHAIKEELADVTLALFSFCYVADVDIIQSINSVIGSNFISSIDVSYQDFEEIIIKNVDKFTLKSFKFPYQVVLSLLNRSSQLADIFVWSTLEDSFKRAQEKHSFVSEHIAYLFAHVVYLSFLIKNDFVTEFERKMKKNILKYPVETSSGQDYIAIKDQFRGRIEKK